VGEDEARMELLSLAATALGVATAADLTDYWTLSATRSRAAIAALVEAGRLLPVKVGDWKQPAFLAEGARIPRRVDTAALLSPFDSLIWKRDRVERLFGFHYRLEIFTPAAKRRLGYYVLPFLLGDRLVGRVDLKADRRAGRLRVLGAWAEADVEPAAVAEAMAPRLIEMASWLGLDQVTAAGAGSLMRHLPPLLR
jgi:uncharacterized protein YcaQ